MKRVIKRVTDVIIKEQTKLTKGIEFVFQCRQNMKMKIFHGKQSYFAH